MANVGLDAAKAVGQHAWENKTELAVRAALLAHEYYRANYSQGNVESANQNPLSGGGFDQDEDKMGNSVALSSSFGNGVVNLAQYGSGLMRTTFFWMAAAMMARSGSLSSALPVALMANLLDVDAAKAVQSKTITADDKEFEDLTNDVINGNAREVKELCRNNLPN